ncbi:hypothetical protein PB2503_00060 [Parvularcula bermudensis HTCC2503]|uniref:Uncharacterized protein n=1 Tax=Parvularcula bermudensis (strain ATCC BAA-594 / HTCC2503 / KCTC 12087) TaxID=314260 RepID=E0THX2_PARBH|nr:hypothetical protein [Parvularcula bermudensis]ADM10783.1 hypothetical protein PB2503_00060 [Parvularcula bermudensis HTCC2503]
MTNLVTEKRYRQTFVLTVPTSYEVICILAAYAIRVESSRGIKGRTGQRYTDHEGGARASAPQKAAKGLISL